MDELASEDLIAVDRDDRGRVVCRLEQLYRVGERDGLAAARVWLSGPRRRLA